jgi:hypothetical protein
VRNIRQPSPTLRNFDAEPSARLPVGKTISPIGKRNCVACTDNSVSISNPDESAGKLFTKRLEKARYPESTEGVSVSAIARAFITALLCLPLSSVTYALALPHDDTSHAATLACLSPQALAPLATLPPGLVLAPIDSGSHIISDTKHSVIAAPYHRNSAGNRKVLEALLASPQAAEAKVRASGARYVMLCPQMHEVQALAERAPQKLVATLAIGRQPDWLVPLPLAGTPYRVFTLRPPSREPRQE